MAGPTAPPDGLFLVRVEYPDALAAARKQWTRMTGWGLAAQYWSDDTGAWTKKSDKPAVVEAPTQPKPQYTYLLSEVMKSACR